MTVWLGGRVAREIVVALQQAGHNVSAADADEDGLAGCDVAVYGAAGRPPAAAAVGALLQRLTAAGVPRLVYLAELGYDMDAPEGALSGAAFAQAEVQVAPIDWTILRVAPLFGSGADGVSELARLAFRLPVVPLPADGGARVQPLAATDLGEVVTRVVAAPLTVGGVFDVAGPEAFRVIELLERVAWVANRRVAACRWPAPLLRLAAALVARAGWPGAAWLAGMGDRLPRDNQAEALLARPPLAFTRAVDGPFGRK
jgi:uncharacterized protein YbjT (DUF2867 family)